MGLLDEAIREHLDLKRRQGADPGEIARKEREALEPVLPDEPATWGEEPSPALDTSLEGRDEPRPAVDEQTAHDEALPAVEPKQDALLTPEAPAVDLSVVGQETVEFDMSELLGEGVYSLPDTTPIGETTTPVRAGRIIQSEPEDAFEWQVAGRSADEPAPGGIRGQERLSFE